MWIESIYSQSLFDVDVHYKNELSHGLLTGFSYWNMYVYIYGW